MGKSLRAADFRKMFRSIVKIVFGGTWCGRHDFNLNRFIVRWFFGFCPRLFTQHFRGVDSTVAHPSSSNANIAVHSLVSHLLSVRNCLAAAVLENVFRVFVNIDFGAILETSTSIF